jgi:hypothetical protein
MRLCLCGSMLVLALQGAAFAQDTNFPTGPQYLMNHGSPMFARPISTPSMSLSEPPLEIGADTATAVLIAGAENQTVLPPSPDALPKVDLFPIYYGVAPVNVIEIRFPEASSSRELPASILDTGVWQVTTAQALRERGYGVTLAEAAAYDKVHYRRATRVYTNADIDRLRGGS